MNRVSVPSLKRVEQMLRHRNTNASGKPFDEATVEAVWEKADISREHAPLRRDAFGALIWREGYGNTNSKLGWEIDHVQPVEQGGRDELQNLQALQWENNRRKCELIRTLTSGRDEQSDPVKTDKMVVRHPELSI